MSYIQPIYSEKLGIFSEFETKSTEKPYGTHMTLLGYIVETNPELFSLVSSPLVFMDDDIPQLNKEAARLGLSVFIVPACSFLMDQGCQTDIAYPRVLLEKVIG